MAGEANFLDARAVRYVDSVNGRERIVSLECPTCEETWDVRNRGRETGFVVAAADNHAIRCAREKHEARLKGGA